MKINIGSLEGKVIEALKMSMSDNVDNWVLQTGSLVEEIKEDFEEKLAEQEKKLEEQEKKLKEEFEDKLKEQEKKIEAAVAKGEIYLFTQKPTKTWLQA